MNANALDLVAYRSTRRIVPFTDVVATMPPKPVAPVVRLYPEREVSSHEDFVQAVGIMVGVAIISFWVWPPHFFYHMTKRHLPK